MPEKIKGGYILFAQKTLESEIMSAPPMYFKLWAWMLMNANWKSNWKYQRGKFETSIKKMQKAMTYYVGGRKEIPSISQIKTAYKYLSNRSMIRLSKSSKGLVITICKYREYQDYRNYESPTESLAESLTIKNTENIPQCGTPENRFESLTKKEAKPLTTKVIDDHKSFRIADPIAHLYNNNNNSNKSIEYSISIYNKNFPCLKHEQDFERDRRIFFESFPGVKTFQLFDDSEKKDKSLTKQFHVKNDIPLKYILRMEELNSKNVGIYLCINETNGKSRKTTDIVRVRAVFADFDGSPLDPVWEFKPSMVVETSPGKYHAYFLTELDEKNNVPLESFRIIQESIATKFNSDPVVKDLPRVMRVPGFEHRKADPFMTRVIHWDDNRFSFGELVEMFPPIPVKQWSAPKYQKPKIINPNAEFKGEYGASKGGRNNHIATRIGGMLNRGLSWCDIEQEAFKEAGACNPPLSGSETRAILNSMRRYA